VAARAVYYGMHMMVYMDVLVFGPLWKGYPGWRMVVYHDGCH